MFIKLLNGLTRFSRWHVVALVLLFLAVGVYGDSARAMIVTKTLGNTTVGTQLAAFAKDVKWGNKRVLSDVAEVSKLTLDSVGGSSTAHVKGMIYDANGSGMPGALVATTDELTLAAGATRSWRDLTFATPPTLQPGTYFLIMITDSNSGQHGFNPVSGVKEYYNTDSYVDGPANPFGLATISGGNYDDSFYMTYTTSVPDPPHNFATGSIPAPKYGVYEVVLTGNGSVSNPFDTVATVTFIPPSGSGSAKTIEAFYDGGNTWKARVYTSEVGDWTWSSASAADPGLDGQNGSFSTTGSELRGMLRKHSTNSKQWMTDNDQTFLGIGDTAYYLFARTNKDGTTISEPTFQQYIQDDAALNINSIFADLNGGGYLDAQWKNIFSDTGSYNSPNLPAFQTTDQRLVWLLDNYPNIYINLDMLPENSSGGSGGDSQPDNTFWSNLSSTQRTRLLRHILARYSAFPQIFWTITNDTKYGPSYPKNTAMVDEAGSYFAAHDPWQHLLGTGQNRDATYYFASASWNSYIRLETSWAYGADEIASYSAYPQHVYNSEDYYEGSSDITNPQYFYRWLFWSWLTSGATPTYGSWWWDRLVPYTQAGWTGLNSVKYIAPYLNSKKIDLAQWQEADSLATDINRTTGDRRPQAMRSGTSEYLIYHPNASSAGSNPSLNKKKTARIQLNLTAASGTFNVEWFRASDGLTQSGGTINGGASRDFTAPWKGQDVVLYLKK